MFSVCVYWSRQWFFCDSFAFCMYFFINLYIFLSFIHSLFAAQFSIIDNFFICSLSIKCTNLASTAIVYYEYVLLNNITQCFFFVVNVFVYGCIFFCAVMIISIFIQIAIRSQCVWSVIHFFSRRSPANWEYYFAFIEFQAFLFCLYFSFLFPVYFLYSFIIIILGSDCIYPFSFFFILCLVCASHYVFFFIPIYFSVTLLLWSRTAINVDFISTIFFSCYCCCCVYLSLIPVFKLPFKINDFSDQFFFLFCLHCFKCIQLFFTFEVAILNDWLSICVKLAWIVFFGYYSVFSVCCCALHHQHKNASVILIFIILWLLVSPIAINKYNAIYIIFFLFTLFTTVTLLFFFLNSVTKCFQYLWACVCAKERHFSI